MAHQAGAYPCFRSRKRLGVFLLPPGGMLVHRRVTPSSKFAGTHLYTWVERGTMGVKCLAQEHNVVPRPWLEPGPFDPESSALTTRPPRLPSGLFERELNRGFTVCKVDVFFVKSIFDRTYLLGILQCQTSLPKISPWYNLQRPEHCEPVEIYRRKTKVLNTYIHW